MRRYSIVLEQHTGLEPVPPVWKTGMLGHYTNATYAVTRGTAACGGGFLMTLPLRLIAEPGHGVQQSSPLHTYHKDCRVAEDPL